MAPNSRGKKKLTNKQSKPKDPNFLSPPQPAPVKCPVPILVREAVTGSEPPLIRTNLKVVVRGRVQMLDGLPTEAVWAWSRDAGLVFVPAKQYEHLPRPPQAGDWLIVDIRSIVRKKKCTVEQHFWKEGCFFEVTNIRRAASDKKYMFSQGPEKQLVIEGVSALVSTGTRGNLSQRWTTLGDNP